MSSTHTNSSSNTYSESRARYVMGKIFDDFHDIAYRGFEQFRKDPNQLQEWRDDLFFLMTKQALEKFQIQFYSSEGKEWAVEYEIKADGSIQVDKESGGTDYWEIPIDATIGITLTRDKSRKDVNDYMENKGWTPGGSYVEGDLIEDRTYSKSGYGATKGRRGSWES